MKALRSLLFLIVLAAVITAGGCAKKYEYSFVGELDLGHGSEAWVKVPYDYNFAFNIFNGVRLDSASIRTPIYFTGDFEITVNFYLMLDSSHIGTLAFILSDDTHPSPFNHAFYMPIYDICDTDEELHIADWRVSPYVYTDFKDDDLPLNSLNSSGSNKLVMTKKGNQMTVVFNDDVADTYGPYTLINYTVDKFYLTFAGQADFSPEGVYGVFIRDVKVEY